MRRFALLLFVLGCGAPSFYGPAEPEEAPLGSTPTFVSYGDEDDGWEAAPKDLVPRPPRRIEPQDPSVCLADVREVRGAIGRVIESALAQDDFAQERCLAREAKTLALYATSPELWSEPGCPADQAAVAARRCLSQNAELARGPEDGAASTRDARVAASPASQP